MCQHVRRHGRIIGPGESIETSSGHVGPIAGCARSETLSATWLRNATIDSIHVDSYLERNKKGEWIEFSMPREWSLKVITLNTPMYGKFNTGDVLVVTRPAEGEIESSVHHRHPMFVRTV